MSDLNLRRTSISSQTTLNGFTDYINELKNEKYFVLVQQQKEIYAKAIGISNEEFTARLKDQESDFVYDIVGYIDGKAVTRFNLIYLFKKTITKIIRRIECENRETLTYDEKRLIMEELELRLNATV
jgi:hypothetical protein